MKRMADILAEELADLGLEQVFMITGGGAMHLNDAFGRCKGLKIFFNHHEQASAMAAEAYARIAGKPAIVNVTTGPGGINALNGVYGAYVDSIPMIVISGQIKRDTMLRNYAAPLRQLGDQEVDIIPMVRPVTKYAVELQNPRRVREVVAKAVYLAQSGRPGPVWIDVPMDIQGAKINEADLYTWDANNAQDILELRGDPDVAQNTLSDFTLLDSEQLQTKIALITEKLRTCKRPVILGGTGVHLSGMEKEFLALGEKLGVPLVGGWNAYDLVPNAHPCYAGRPGTVGDRPGNFTVQNADFLLTLGCRLNIRQISYNWGAFAKRAWKAQVDVDNAELAKPTLNNDLAVQADLRLFLPLLNEALNDWQAKAEHKEYLAWCQERVQRYPVLQKNYANDDIINPYYFVKQLSLCLEEDDVIVSANGSCCVLGFQASTIKKTTRFFTNSGCASMGFELPAAIGAAIANGGKRVICLAGDGSIMMNLQELQTIVGNRLPIIIFVLNNDGYLSIRQTQNAYFPDSLIGIDAQTGVTFPNFTRLATAFGIRSRSISKPNEIRPLLKEALLGTTCALYDIFVDPNQTFEPKLMSRALPDGTMCSPELDDMAPFLSAAELEKNRLRR